MLIQSKCSATPGLHFRMFIGLRDVSKSYLLCTWQARAPERLAWLALWALIMALWPWRCWGVSLTMIQEGGVEKEIMLHPFHPIDMICQAFMQIKNDIQFCAPIFQQSSLGWSSMRSK